MQWHGGRYSVPVHAVHVVLQTIGQVTKLAHRSSERACLRRVQHSVCRLRHLTRGIDGRGVACECSTPLARFATHLPVENERQRVGVQTTMSHATGWVMTRAGSRWAIRIADWNCGLCRVLLLLPGGITELPTSAYSANNQSPTAAQACHHQRHSDAGLTGAESSRVQDASDLYTMRFFWNPDRSEDRVATALIHVFRQRRKLFWRLQDLIHDFQLKRKYAVWS